MPGEIYKHFQDRQAPDKVGDLRVWHIPQVPMEAFRWKVKTPEEAVALMDALAAYDDFQLANDVKPDYASAAGLEEYVSEGPGHEEWVEWYHPETGDDIDSWARQQKGED